VKVGKSFMREEQELLVGWGEADTTPDSSSIELSGQYYQRTARGIHSCLKAVALVMQQGRERVVMVSLDGVGVPECFCKRVEEKLAQAIPDLAGARLMLNATHTHSAPSLSRTFNWWAPNPEALTCDMYQDIVEEKIVEAVGAAWTARQAAGLTSILEYARIGHCRRTAYADGSAEMYGFTDREDFVRMEGGEDSGVELLFFFDCDRRPMGAIVNVACPSQVMEAQYMVSSDFMGALREKLKAEFGDHFCTLCQVSAAGDQSPRDLSRNYKSEPDFWHEDGVEVVSDRLLTAVKRAFPRAVDSICYEPVLAQSVTGLALPIRKVTAEEAETAGQEVARLEKIQDSADAYKEFCETVLQNEKIPGRPGPYDDKNMHFVLIRNAEAVVKRYKTQSDSPDFEMRLHVVRVGDVVFASNPFELFLEFGQRMKARSSAAQTFVVQLANGIGGYLPTRYAEELGGYGALVINGIVGSEGGTQLVDETLAAIEALWS